MERHALRRVVTTSSGKVSTRGQSVCVAGETPIFMLPFLLGKQMAGAFAECQEETAGKSKCTESGEKRLRAFGRNNVSEGGAVRAVLINMQG